MTWTPIHFLTFNAIYNTHTHRNNVRFTIPNRRRQGRLPSCRQEATAIHRRQREDGSRQRYASAEKFCFFERRTNHHHKPRRRHEESSPSLSDWITAKPGKIFFLHLLRFSPRGSIVFLVLPFPSKLCARFVSSFIFQSEGE